MTVTSKTARLRSSDKTIHSYNFPFLKNDGVGKGVLPEAEKINTRVYTTPIGILATNLDHHQPHLTLQPKMVEERESQTLGKDGDGKDDRVVSTVLIRPTLRQMLRVTKKSISVPLHDQNLSVTGEKMLQEAQNS